MRGADRAGLELRALARTLYFTEGNSREQKVALWAAMLLFTIGGVGILYGFVDLSDPGVYGLWTLLVSVMTFLWGRAQGHEIRLIKNDESNSPRNRR